MTPYDAVELIVRYSFLTKAIKAATLEIGNHLNECSGMSGKRNTDSDERKTDKKNHETDLHLHDWYTPEIVEYGGCSWLDIDEECKEQCPHCYAAHQVIQQRKEYRLKLGHVKRAMTRGGS